MAICFNGFIFELNYTNKLDMTIHKEGYATLMVSGILFAIVTWVLCRYVCWLCWPIGLVLLALWLFLVSFFRNPDRKLKGLLPDKILCPADGKIVVIEETEENEYFKDKRLMVSVFMSPLNVHVNRNPVSGIVRYFKYHPGKYLAAWEPKASTVNERTTTEYETTGGKSILIRQVAGALARRIVWYVGEGNKVIQGEDMGFIKLGSRVDLYLPVGTKVLVKIGDVVKGNITEIAEWK